MLKKTHDFLPAGLRPVDEVQAKQIGMGMAKMLRSRIKERYASVMKGRKPTGGKLKLDQTTYLGTQMTAWTDDSYYRIPYEGELTNEARLVLGELLRSNRSGFDLYFGEPGAILAREVYMIGD